MAMTRLVAAMDVSGSRNDRYDGFIAIVIGVGEYMQSVIESVGYDRIHMRRVPKKIQERIMSGLKLDNSKCIAFCVKIDGRSTVNSIAGMRRMKNRHAAHEKVAQTFNRLLFSEIRDEVLDFLSKHDGCLPDVVFQCDRDCISFAKDAGLRYARAGQVHENRIYELADIIAWMNNKGKEPKNAIVLDVTKKIEARLRNDFLK